MNAANKIVQQQETQLLLQVDSIVFTSLADQFTSILNEAVQYLHYQGSRQSMIRYKADSGTGLWLKLYLDCSEKINSRGIINIVRFNVCPPRQGLGSRIIRRLFAALRQTPFTSVSLIPANQAAVAFWRKMGFEFKKGAGDYRMMIDLLLWEYEDRCKGTRPE